MSVTVEGFAYDNLIDLYRSTDLDSIEVDLGAMLAAERGDPVYIEGVSDPTSPDSALYESDERLAGPDAIIVGPTFAEWLDTNGPLVGP